MLKILYIITQSELGGAQKNVLDLAMGLKNKYEILVAAGLSFAKASEGKLESNSQFFEELQKNQVPCARLKYLQRTINPYFDLRGLLEIKKLIQKEQPDILHLHSSKAGVLGSIAGKLLISGKKPKIIYTVHGAVFTAAFSTLTQKMFLWLEKYTARFKDKIICVSANDKKLWLKNKAAAENKLIVVHNGINAEKMNFINKERAREELSKFLDVRHPEIQMPQYLGGLTSPKTKIVGTIANFYPEKGLSYLIKAAKIMNKNEMTPEAIFVVIGEGREREKLETMIEERNLEKRFFLVGTLKEAAQYLKAFDIFVLPSIKEGFPYVLLEAMAASLPIIASLVGGVGEIIKNSENGFLILSKNPKILAERIAEVLDSPELAIKFSRNNKEKIKGFSAEKMIEETEKIYLAK